VLVYTPCRIKNARHLIFYNLKKTEETFIIFSLTISRQSSHAYLHYFAIFQDSRNNAMSHFTAKFVNIHFNKEDLF